MLINLMILQRTPKTRRQRNSMDNNNESIDENNATSSLEIASSTSNSVIEDVLSPKVSPNVECNWMVGQLAWARVGNFPFWPCIVTFDPTSMTYHKLRSKFFYLILNLN